KAQGKRLIARIIANTGTKLVGYQGYNFSEIQNAAPNFGPFDLDLTDLGSKPGSPTLFYPFTTTLIEITLNRVPLPPVDIFSFPTA
ncbi:MAG TPA: hypothetical protein VLK33_07525, partial [Terriglobales bacterium]|nr:hypothetical protein [Terriglobales bacterium]